jgi:hypothetical protein
MDVVPQFKLEIFVPASHMDALREALAEAGAGRVGNYDHCCSVLNVRGYWRPLVGACPYQGRIGQIEEGEECKVEVNCPRDRVRDVLETIRRVHPYEEPVINIIPLANFLFE